jgi:hypothetical protein
VQQLHLWWGLLLKPRTTPAISARSSMCSEITLSSTRVMDPASEFIFGLLLLSAAATCPRPVYRLLNPLGFAAGQLAVFQGASEVPISVSYGSSGRLLRCSSVTYRSIRRVVAYSWRESNALSKRQRVERARYAPLAPVRLGPPRR